MHPQVFTQKGSGKRLHVAVAKLLFVQGFKKKWLYSPAVLLCQVSLFMGENTLGSRFCHLSNGTGMAEPPLFECLKDIKVGLERIFLKLHENKMATMMFAWNLSDCPAKAKVKGYPCPPDLEPVTLA